MAARLGVSRSWFGQGDVDHLSWLEYSSLALTVTNSSDWTRCHQFTTERLAWQTSCLQYSVPIIISFMVFYVPIISNDYHTQNGMLLHLPAAVSVRSSQKVQCRRAESGLALRPVHDNQLLCAAGNRQAASAGASPLSSPDPATNGVQTVCFAGCDWRTLYDPRLGLISIVKMVMNLSSRLFDICRRGRSEFCCRM